LKTLVKKRWYHPNFLHNMQLIDFINSSNKKIFSTQFLLINIIIQFKLKYPRGYKNSPPSERIVL
jgi:hypothetical protein